MCITIFERAKMYSFVYFIKLIKTIDKFKNKFSAFKNKIVIMFNWYGSD